MDSLTVTSQKQLLAELYRLAAERQQAELHRQSGYDERARQAVQDFRDAQQSITRQYRIDKETAEREYDRIRQKAADDYKSLISTTEESLHNIEQRLASQYEAAVEKIIKDDETEQWEANAVFDSTRNGPKLRLDTAESNCRSAVAKLEATLEQAKGYIRSCGISPESSLAASATAMSPASDPPLTGDELASASQPVDGESLADLNNATAAASEQLRALQALSSPRMFRDGRIWGIHFLILIICIVPMLLFVGLAPVWLSIAAVVALLLCGGLHFSLKRKAAASAGGVLKQLVKSVQAGTSAARQHLASVKHQCDQELRRLQGRRDLDLLNARNKRQRFLSTVEERRSAEQDRTKSEAERIQREATERRDNLIANAEAKYPPKIEQIQQTYRTSLDEAQKKFEQSKLDNDQQHASEWSELVQHWQAGMARVAAQLHAAREMDQALFPDWTSPVWASWNPPQSAPPSLRFGEFEVDLTQVPGALSTDAELNAGIPERFNLPALMDFPRAASLLIQATGTGRDEALDVVRSCMLRLLLSAPAGKVRFTIVDPVGLGENFAGFMHLADYDDVLVTSRIWTEPQHIEQRLTDLTEQMENIIQKYLRNEFKTIEEYNAHAGEVAEAFRILVVANFPSGFTESSARRLISIISSGARCGVYTFMTVDANQMMPPGIDLNDIVPYCTCLLWKDGQFIWRDPDFRPFELSVDRSPDDAQFSKLVHMAGESAKDSRRVEVPFDYIAPRPETYWKGSTSDGVNIALGRAGATKLQYMRLGQGTSQHVLIAGKTGSGKSTLLHALVTNLALTYSPDEIELYLIDFKKGVEFKTYATHELPHARVIAIESEREFGLSVLQNLDAELRKRGDLFRATNAQDLKSYRAAVPKAVLPRMLLIIDEFHELFVEDDKIAQDAALLLDRLVRQGRAFGIHILLGSQTLGGAYSLARSTIGQMGIRIALQCSEADAHLILSEENTAARLLSRPGEAIYNDAGGLLEGNNPFQVVWLSDARRDDYLDLVTALDAARPRGKQLRQIVFEGNAPADIRRNELLQSSFNQAPWFTGSVSAASSGSSPHGAVTTGSVPTSALAWFGEAVAIKEPTAARFKRENANNLLIIGQREEAAAALLASTMLSIAAQYPPANSIDQGAGARFYVLESPRADGQQAHRLSELAAIIPHSVQVAGRRELPEMLELLAVEVKRRHAANDSAAVPELFLMIHDLARFRDLRRDENDMGFSFGSEPKKATPDKLWSVILRDGPPVGIHTVCWCDNLANLNRAVDRQVMREFDLRILFQMSPSDSSTLVDTPIASKLGQQLALFQNDEAGVLEKFRPYRWPDQQWLAELSRQTRSQATADSDGVVPTAAR